MRLIDFFDRGADLNPMRLCVKDATVARTYREVQERSCKIANALSAAGFTPGQAAAVYSPNAAVAFECILGIMRGAYVWVPINARNTVDENADIIGRCDIEILFYHSEFATCIDQVRRQCPKIKIVICIDGTPESGHGLENWIAEASAAPPDIPVDRDAIASIFSSGGTTGRPKGVPWTNLVWETLIANFFSAMPVGKPPVHLIAAPMTHAAGAIGMILTAAGATQVILPGFDAVKVLNAIEREGVTHLFLPPTAIYMLLAQPGLDARRFSSLEHFIYAAAPMSVDKLKECLDVFGPVMTQVFGQAEAPILCTFLSPDDHRVIGDPEKEKRLASCGRPTLLTPVGIMDDAGNLLPAGERGEIVVRGNLVMPGYYKNPEATREVSAFGWHHTGDIGFKDQDGYVYIVDRKKDMIISGGFNVYPSEVEQVIWSHPAVQDCAVVGAPDDKWGEAVTAVIELKPGYSVEPAEIIALCKERLGSVKAPKSVQVWESLPRSPVGKVRKKDIREMFWQGRARMI